ncbi:hypothetical protein [Streptomyces sp. NPDC001205]
MSKPPAGYHHVRAHIRRNPGPRDARRMSGWLTFGHIALAVLWSKYFGLGDTSASTPTEQRPTPSVSQLAPCRASKSSGHHRTEPMVMTRIEDEESDYARQAASTLRGITPELLDDINTKRT